MNRLNTRKWVHRSFFILPAVLWLVIVLKAFIVGVSGVFAVYIALGVIVLIGSTVIFLVETYSWASKENKENLSLVDFFKDRLG